MKTILAIWNKAGKGKSDSIREFATLLLNTYPTNVPTVTNPIKSKSDFSIIIEINGKKIGIESQGDPGTKLQERLSKLVTKGCEVIICSTRTSGETANAVIDIGKKSKYQIIWTSTYEIDDTSQHKTLNTLKGKHILDLLLSLNVLEFNVSKIL